MQLDRGKLRAETEGNYYSSYASLASCLSPSPPGWLFLLPAGELAVKSTAEELAPVAVQVGPGRDPSLGLYACKQLCSCRGHTCSPMHALTNTHVLSWHHSHNPR